MISTYNSTNPPKQPVPEEFGLTEELITISSEKEKVYRQKNSDFSNFMGPAFFIIIGLTSIFLWESFNAASILIGLLIAACTAALFSPKQPEEDAALYLKCTQYWNALGQYAKDVEKYRQLCILRGEWRKQKEDRKGLRKERSYWLSLNDYEFETNLAELLCDKGVEAQVTRRSGDQGVDIWIIDKGVASIVQCKAHQKPVGIKDAREFLGTKIHLKANRAILASRSGFTESVASFASQHGIELMDLNDILKMAT